MEEQPIATSWVNTARVDKTMGPHHFKKEAEYRWMEIRAGIKARFGELLLEHKNIAFSYKERQQDDSYQAYLIGELKFHSLADGETLMSEITRLRRALLGKDEEIERLNRELGEAWAHALQEGDEVF